MQSDITNEVEVLGLAPRSRARVLNAFMHELRSPLNAIIRLTDILSNTRLTPEQVEVCRQSHAAAQGLPSPFNDIRGRARTESESVREPLGPTDLGALVTHVRQVLEAKGVEADIELVDRVSPNLPSFALQESRLYRVLLNLVSNALKYTQRGEVILSVEARAVVLTGPGWDRRYSVGDTGIGMNVSQLEQLMQPSARVHDRNGMNPPSTGLGLLVCDETPRAMGSTLKVHSERGAGSQFWFTLAADEPELGEVTGGRDAQEVRPIAKPSLDGLRILVVDDNPLV